MAPTIVKRTYKRVIGKRTTANQKRLLLEYMEQNLDFANDRKYARGLVSTKDNSTGLIKPIPAFEQRILEIISSNARTNITNNTDTFNTNIDTTTSSFTTSNNTETSCVNNFFGSDEIFDISEFEEEEESTTTKIQRCTRASEIQKLELVKYFEDNCDSVRELTIGNSKARQKIWIELAHRLNMLDGTLKTSLKWSKYWNDIVSYTKNRATSTITGSLDRWPNELDKRILNIVGYDHLLKEWYQTLKTKPIKLEKEKEFDLLRDDNALFQSNKSNSEIKGEIFFKLEDDDDSNVCDNNYDDDEDNSDDENDILQETSSIEEGKHNLVNLTEKTNLMDLKRVLDQVIIGKNDNITLNDLPNTLFAISELLDSFSTLIKKTASAITQISQDK